RSWARVRRRPRIWSSAAEISGWLCGGPLLAQAFPIPGQEFVDAPGGVIRQACQHVGEPGLRIDIVELASLDQRVDGGSAATAFIGTHEGPVVPAHRDRTHPALGRIVGHAQAAVVEEASERGPTIEAV